jgi:hypothetical protein
MFRKPKDKVDLAIAAGAFVVKPKPAVTEPVPVAVQIIQPELVDIAVSRLQKQWNNPEPQLEPSKAQPTPEYPEVNGEEPTVGDVLDLVVVAWMTHDKTGQNRGGIGLARILRGSRRRQEKRSDGCHFREADIISLGVETVRPGSRLRARLADPTSEEGHPFILKDVEIYQE